MTLRDGCEATPRGFAEPGRAARDCKVFFFCGPDEAGATAAAATIHAMLPEPGERVELSGAELRRDPARLGDEARSSSLFGDARHIFVRASGDEAHDALANLFEGEGEASVLVVATSATDNSHRQAPSQAADALVAMFYPPDLRSFTGTVRDLADQAGLHLGGDMAERIARAAGLDQRLAASEIEKLALYLDATPASPKSLSLEDWEAVGASTEEDGFMPLVNAALSGHVKRLPSEVERMRQLSLNPVGMALAFERRAAQLAQLASRLGPRGDVDSFLQSEKQARRVFWKDERDLREQLRVWRGARLDRLVARLTALHRQLLGNSQSADVLIAQEVTQIANAASRARR